MNKVLLISGSNRKWNTEYILSQISKEIENSELILLREKNIEYCKGCLTCHEHNKCIIKDDMNILLNKLLEADFIIFGVPNYFDNVSGLFKNFIDRLHPFYKSEQLKGKKVIFIFVGGGKEEGTKETLHQSINGISKYLLVDIKAEFSFKALNGNDMKKQSKSLESLMCEIKKYI